MAISVAINTVFSLVLLLVIYGEPAAVPQSLMSGLMSTLVTVVPMPRPPAVPAIAFTMLYGVLLVLVVTSIGLGEHYAQPL